MHCTHAAGGRQLRTGQEGLVWLQAVVGRQGRQRPLLPHRGSQQLQLAAAAAAATARGAGQVARGDGGQGAPAGRVGRAVRGRRGRSVEALALLCRRLSGRGGPLVGLQERLCQLCGQVLPQGGAAAAWGCYLNTGMPRLTSAGRKPAAAGQAAPPTRATPGLRSPACWRGPQWSASGAPAG